MKPWRRMTLRESDSLPIVDSTEFLDTQEQEKIVQSLETSHFKQSLFWRVIFASLGGAFSLFFAISAYSQATSPWERKYHAYFMENLNAMTVVTADICEAAIYAFTAWSVLWGTSSPYGLRWIPLATGCVLTCFWLYHMLRLPSMHWNVLWLPLGSSCFAAVCLYVDHLMVETEKEVQALRSSMYHFKKT